LEDAMARVKITEIGEGIHPSEVVVAVATNEGTENLVVDRRSMKDGAIEIGYPIRQQGDLYLVEFPRETMSGSWRGWVHSDLILLEDERVRA
jgi:hypothetical protein